MRRLEYSYTAEYQFSGEGHSSGFAGGGMGGSGSGINSTFGSGGRVGVLDVDVLGFADDGQLAFNIKEEVQNQPRATQAINCETEDTGQVICDAPFIPSDIEAAALIALGRSFVPDGIAVPGGTWSRAYQTKNVDVNADYTISSSSASDVLAIQAKRVTKRPGNVGNDWTETERITYDRPLKIPTEIYDETSGNNGGNTHVHSVLHLQLTKDSFAKPATTAPSASP